MDVYICDILCLCIPSCVAFYGIEHYALSICVFSSEIGKIEMEFSS